MKYSIQARGGGSVYGIYDAPVTEPPLSTEDYVVQLQGHFAEVPGLEFTSIPLYSLDGSHEDRFVIAIDEFNAPRSLDIPDIHAAVGMVWLMHELGEEA